MGYPAAVDNAAMISRVGLSGMVASELDAVFGLFPHNWYKCRMFPQMSIPVKSRADRADSAVNLYLSILKIAERQRFRCQSHPALLCR